MDDALAGVPDAEIKQSQPQDPTTLSHSDSLGSHLTMLTTCLLHLRHVVRRPKSSAISNLSVTKPTNQKVGDTLEVSKINVSQIQHLLETRLKILEQRCQNTSHFNPEEL